MLTLHELQKQFIESLQNGNNAVLNYILPSSKLSAKAHLTIYQSSVRGALQKVLKDIYNVCDKLVGEDFFILMMNSYIENHTSQSHHLGDYGADFADFIAEYQPAKSLAYLADVARLEWAWHRIFSAPPAKGIDFQKLAECYSECAEKIIFYLPPESVLISSAFPIHRIWEVNQASFNADTTVVLPENQMFYYFIWRKELEMRIDILEPADWHILKLIQSGATISQIYEKIMLLFPNLNFTEVLTQIVSKAWLADFSA